MDTLVKSSTTLEVCYVLVSPEIPQPELEVPNENLTPRGHSGKPELDFYVCIQHAKAPHLLFSTTNLRKNNTNSYGVTSQPKHTSKLIVLAHQSLSISSSVTFNQHVMDMDSS